jgi:TatD DNase family protein
MFIDTHAHLLDKRYDPDRDDAIIRANKNKVEKILEIACEPGEWNAALELAVAKKGIYCVVGIHPQEAKIATPKILEDLERIAGDGKVVAIGETGLDYHYENSPREIQKKIFEHHIELSQKTGKPLVVHSREAYADLMQILKKQKFQHPRPGVVHCFSGTPDQALELIAMGFYIGIDGPVTYPKASNLKETVKRISLENILIETDSPYLPPQSYRGTRNEPSYISLIAEEIAAIKNVTTDEVAKITSENARSLFKI